MASNCEQLPRAPITTNKPTQKRRIDQADSSAHNTADGPTAQRTQPTQQPQQQHQRRASQQQPRRPQQQPNRRGPANNNGNGNGNSAPPKAPQTPSQHQQQQQPTRTPTNRRAPAGDGSHSVTKRPTAKLSQRPNDIYVSNKSDFQAQLKQCNRLLSTSDFHEVFLHAIGNAVTRAINLALQLVDESEGGLGYEANTSTIELTDNLHPLHDDGDFAVKRRLNGCLHVRVYRHCRDVLLLADDSPDSPDF